MCHMTVAPQSARNGVGHDNLADARRATYCIERLASYIPLAYVQGIQDDDALLNFGCESANLCNEQRHVEGFKTPWHDLLPELGAFGCRWVHRAEYRPTPTQTNPNPKHRPALNTDQPIADRSYVPTRLDCL